MDERVNVMLRGVVSGIVATAVYTSVSACVKERARSHESVQPAQVAAAFTGTDATRHDPSSRRFANAALHWGYGIWGGLLRAMLERKGLTGWRADLAHLAAFWLPWRLVALAHPPDKRRSRQERNAELFADFGKHLAYVLTARLVYGRSASRAGRR